MRPKLRRWVILSELNVEKKMLKKNLTRELGDGH